MKKKASRLEAIRKLISNEEISSQDELLSALIQEGFELTQATLSRDLKQMKVAKAVASNGKYVYVLPNNIMYRRSVEQPKDNLPAQNGFISLQFSGNMAVVRTRPGYASMIAFDIDDRNLKEVLGTVAGDDTIMLVLEEGLDHDTARDLLSFVILGK